LNLLKENRDIVNKNLLFCQKILLTTKINQPILASLELIEDQLGELHVVIIIRKKKRVDY